MIDITYSQHIVNVYQEQFLPQPRKEKGKHYNLNILIHITKLCFTFIKKELAIILYKFKQ